MKKSQTLVFLVFLFDEVQKTNKNNKTNRIIDNDILLKFI